MNVETRNDSPRKPRLCDRHPAGGRWLLGAAVLALGLGLVAAPAQADLRLELPSDCIQVQKLTLVPFGASGEGTETLQPGAFAQDDGETKRWVLTDPEINDPLVEGLDAGLTYRVFKQNRPLDTIGTTAEGFARIVPQVPSNTVASMDCVVGQSLPPAPPAPVTLSFSLGGDWGGGWPSGGEASFSGTIVASDANYDGRLQFSHNPNESEASAFSLQGQARQGVAPPTEFAVTEQTDFLEGSFSLNIPSDGDPPQQVGNDVLFTIVYGSTVVQTIDPVPNWEVRGGQYPPILVTQVGTVTVTVEE